MEYRIQFVNEKVQEAFENLAEGDYEEKELKRHLERAFNDIIRNPSCGIQIPKKQIPKEYLQKFNIRNVFKYNLPNAWRLIYSKESEGLFIISIILEWVDHKEYERRFRY